MGALSRGDLVSDLNGFFEAEVLPRTAGPSDRLGADLGLDSVDFFRVIMFIEQVTGCFVPDEAIERELTLGDVAALYETGSWEA